MSRRASDSDRSNIAEKLREATSEGRLTMGELSERLDEVMLAKTYADLHECLRELPDYDDYSPWQKSHTGEVGLRSTKAAHGRGRPSTLALIVVGLGIFVFIPILTALTAGLVLFALKILIFTLSVIAIFRLLRFSTRLAPGIRAC